MFRNPGNCSYVQYSAICARVVRQVLRNDLRVEAAKRDQAFIRKVEWKDGKAIKVGYFVQHNGYCSEKTELLQKKLKLLFTYGEDEQISQQKSEVLGSRSLRPRVCSTIDKNHVATVGDSSGMWKGTQGLSEEDKLKAKSYYSNQKEPHGNSTSSYDSIFNVDYEYNSKLHRDDRQHRVGLDINTEETGRSVPVRSSSMYGRRVHQPLEMPNRQHVRTDKINKGFMRPNGVGIPKSSDVKCVGLIESS